MGNHRTVEVIQRPSLTEHSIYIYIFFFSVFCLFRATPAAYGGSQARAQIGAVAAGLRQSHSNAESELHLQPAP